MKTLAALCAVVASMFFVYQHLFNRQLILPISSELIKRLDPDVFTVFTVDASRAGQLALLREKLNLQYSAEMERYKTKFQEGGEEDIEPPDDNRELTLRLVSYMLPIQGWVMLGGNFLDKQPVSTLNDLLSVNTCVICFSRGSNAIRYLLSYYYSVTSLPRVPNADIFLPNNNSDINIGMIDNCIVLSNNLGYVRNGVNMMNEILPWRQNLVVWKKWAALIYIV